MISTTRRWLRRNRNGIAIAAGAIGATYLAGQYVLGKISEARERMNLDRIAKENIKRRFEQNQLDCTFTVLALLPTVTENIIEQLPVEQLTQELQQKKAERLAKSSGEGARSELSSAPSSIRDGDTASLSSFQTSSFMHTSQLAEDQNQSRSRKTKAQLWNEIKITSITRACTLIYTLSLLTIITRIQLNLLGRLSYLTSVISLAQPPPPERSNSISLEDHDDSNPATSAGFGNDFETNRRYLTFSWYLLHRGYAQVLAKVREAVTETFGTISPTEPISQARLSELILSIRKKVEGSTEQERYSTRWLPYLLPNREDEESVLIESGVITPPPSSSSNSSPEPTPESGPNRPTAISVNTSSGQLRSLLDETADLIDSPTFTRIHTMILNNLFSYLIDTQVAEQAFPPPQSSPTGPRVEEVSSSITIVPTGHHSEPKVKLATILAILTRQAHAIGRGNTSSSTPDPASMTPTSTNASQTNEYLSLIDAKVKELEAFAAVIYAHNLHNSPQLLDQHLEPTRSSTEQQQRQPAPTDNPVEATIKSSDGIGVSDVGPSSNERGLAVQADEMLESTLEGAWSKIVGSASGLGSR